MAMVVVLALVHSVDLAGLYRLFSSKVSVVASDNDGLPVV